MNELRMYVEHLFEGRTLTNDVIELKEEIYGNLVARYDDYLAQGMGETDALTKTMASITGVDELLDGLDEQNHNIGSDTDSGKTQSLETAPTTPAEALPQQPTPSAPTRPARRKGPSIALMAVAAVAVVLVVVGIFSAIIGSTAFLSAKQQTTDASIVSLGSAATTGRAGADQEATPQSTIEMQLEDLRLEDIQQYLIAGIMTNEANLSELLAHLPGSTLNPGIGAFDPAGRSVTIDYRYQEGSVDDDQLESALLFNAAVLMCATDAPDSVRFNICDVADDGGRRDENASDGQDASRSSYLFSREMLEGPGGFGYDLTPDRVGRQADLDRNFRDVARNEPEVVGIIAGNAYVL